MGNPRRGEVGIQLDRPRTLRLDMNDFAEMEEILGRPLSGGQTVFSFREIRAVLFVGLRHEDRTLTLQKAGELMSYIPVTELSEKISDCIIRALGQEGEAPGAGADGSTG